METIINMLSQALLLGSPLIIAGLGGLFSERSGIINIALEGGMLVGAFAAAASVVFFEQAGINLVWVAMLIAMVASTLFISIHAFASIHMKADQTISGTALNVLSTGLTVYLCEILFSQKSTEAFGINAGFTKVAIPLLSDIPVIGPLFDNYPTVYVAFILVAICYFVLLKTPFGLRLRSCGEFPQASASMGISVSKMRWCGVLISGALSGLAGGAFVITTSTYFQASTIHGLGFIAIATLIFGRYHPVGLMFAGLFFGFAQTLGFYSSSISFLSEWPTEIFSMFPYVLTIIALVLFSGKSAAPKAAGEIYDAGKR